MSFEFRMSTRRRGTPGANNSPFTRKLSITISTVTPVVLGASCSGGASGPGATPAYCSVSVSISDPRGHACVFTAQRAAVFAALAEEASPLRFGQRPHDHGVELSSCVAQELLHGVFVCSRFAVRPLGRHCHVRIENRQDASSDRYLLARNTSRIALAVVPLVVTADHLRQLAKEADLAQHAVADLRMPLHFSPVVFREVFFLQQDRLSDASFANIAQCCRLVHEGCLFGRHSHLSHKNG